MDEPFGRVRSIVTRLASVLRCQKCLTLKEEDLMVFFHFCDHFYCCDCLGSQISCPICENPLDKPIKVRDDKSILSLYQSFLKFELPSKEKIEIIYKTYKESKEIHEQNLNEVTEQNEKIVSNSKAEHNEEQTDKESEPFHEQNLDKVAEQHERILSNSKTKHSKENEQIVFPVNETVEKVCSENSSNKNGHCNAGEIENSVKRKKLVKEKNTSFTSDIDSESNSRKSNNSLTPKMTRSRKKKTAGDVTPAHVDTSKDLATTPSSHLKTQSSSSKININKRNAKGETQLHLACKKSNFTLMKELIDAGANLNAKDNAGWTPLHDSVFCGNIEVVKFLLDNGAKINIPGLENTTALHEAIAKENSKLVKLLVDHGADIHAKNIFRETPLDLVTKYNFTELKEILLESTKSSRCESSLVDEEAEESLENKALYKHNLNIDDEKLVNKFAEKFNWDLASCLTPKITPTHIVVPEKKFDVTWRLISFVPFGCRIATVKWVRESLEESIPRSPDLYRPAQKIAEGFAKARLNKRNHLPDLFSGCHFFFGGNFEFYEVKSITIGKEILKSLVERNGGAIVKRCPDPECLTLEKTIPFHANSSGSLRETSYFIIYQSEKWDPKPKYNMSHMKTLSVEWLVACIGKFELIDPKEFAGLDL